MKKYGIVLVMVMFAVIALAAAPAVAAGTDSMKQSRATVRGSELMGMEVVNANDEEIGTVEDVIIGFDGRVNYLIVEQDGIQTEGNDRIPVPFSALDPKGRQEQKLVLNVSEEELQSAPRFSQNEYPEFGDTTYDQEVHGYYGAPTLDDKNWPDFEGGAWNPGEEPKVMPGSQGGMPHGEYGQPDESDDPEPVN